jgi:hypothetical protein
MLDLEIRISRIGIFVAYEYTNTSYEYSVLG